MTLVLNAEMDHHLAGEEPGSRRNGYGRKTVITDTGQIELAVPRDREVRFDLQLIAKYQRRFPGFDDKIISMYARGMSTREIVGHLRDLYGIEVSPDLISAVTDAVLEEVAAWQARAPWKRSTRWFSSMPCGSRIRDEGLVRNKAHRARRARRWHQGDPRPLARAERSRQILAARHERAEKPRGRGRADRCRRRPEGLSGGDHRRFPAGHGSGGAQRLRRGLLGQKYPAIGQSWRRAWGEVVPFYAFPATFDAFCTPQTPSKR